jgi:hypothetical protein
MRSTVTALTLLLAGCATQPALVKQTKSGYAEGVFTGASVDDVRNRIMAGCSDGGFLVEDSSGNQVVCAKTLQGGQEVFARMLVGNAYSTTPQVKVRFTAFAVGSDVRVTGQSYVESQMPGGQVNRQELTSNRDRNDVQQFLFKVGAQ